MRRILVLVVSGLAATASLLASGVVSANAALPHTHSIVVRPVHSNGQPVAGYSVSHETIQNFSCSGPSLGAVDPNIEFCGFSATYTVACWKSTNHTVLCLRNPRVKHLARIHYQGAFTPTAAPAHPSPQALTLFSNNYCTVRDGGAWSQISGHPRWNGDYSCNKNGIYGRGRDGIDRSVNPWRVHVVNNPHNNTPHAIVLRRVKLAYYVGTAS